jgi:hypothetical protein
MAERNCCVWIELLGWEGGTVAGNDWRGGIVVGNAAG